MAFLAAVFYPGKTKETDHWLQKKQISITCVYAFFFVHKSDGIKKISQAQEVPEEAI